MTTTNESSKPLRVASTEGLGLRAPTEQDVLAKMRLHRPNWNAYGMPREGAVDLAIKCALELGAAALDQLQARIDALMLEHCPDEMTPEQMAAWANAQVAAPGFDEAALDAALKAERLR